MPHPTRLLTTRWHKAVAFILTTLVLVQTIRDLLRAAHTKPGWLFVSVFQHASLWVALNVFFYIYLCWLAFCFVRGTQGTERIFVVGWFASILFSPLQMFSRWSVVIGQIQTVGLGVALLASLALLLNTADTSDSKSSE